MESQDSPETEIPLWLDCDTGHDDAYAILLAAHHPSLNLLGISTVHGNASLDQTTANTLSILTAIGRADVPVHPGATKPFCRQAVHAPDIHGTTGLDGTTCMPTPAADPVGRPNAVLAMRHALMDQPTGTAWVVATGALTNVALLFATFPELVDHIKGLSIMGGAIGDGFTDAPMGRVGREEKQIGNHTRWAEFNIYCDPEAAESIFANHSLVSKTTLIPLDLTHKFLADQPVQQKLLHGPLQDKSPESAPNRIRLLFHEILMYFAHTYSRVFGFTTGPPLHDPLAVAATLGGPDGERLFHDNGGERWQVEVDTDGLHSEKEEEQGQVGRTRANLIDDSGGPTSGKRGRGGVRIPRALNQDLLWDMLDQCLQRAEEAIARPPEEIGYSSS